MKKKTLILIILSFPITFTLYIFLFANDIKLQQEVIINSNIDSLSLTLSNPSNIKKYMPDNIISYKLINGAIGENGANAEIKMNSNGNEIILKESIIKNNLPTEMIISYESNGISKIVTQTLEKISEKETKLTRIEEFKFKGYMKFISFFMESALNKQNRVYLNSIKEYAESNNPLD